MLCRAAHVLEAPIYVFSDDAKDFFNQLGMATEELWKLGVVFLENIDAASDEAKLYFISEKKLGFGTHSASNTAHNDLVTHCSSSSETAWMRERRSIRLAQSIRAGKSGEKPEVKCKPEPTRPARALEDTPPTQQSNDVESKSARNFGCTTS